MNLIEYFFISVHSLFRKLTGLRKEDVYCNLRIPDQFQKTNDDINIVIFTGWYLEEKWHFIIELGNK